MGVSAAASARICRRKARRRVVASAAAAAAVSVAAIRRPRQDKDKKISRDEWPAQMPQQFFDRLDTNHDGFIDEAEWNAMRQRFGQGGGSRFGESLAKFLDANKDGKVSRDEFAKIVALFDLLDQDHNGELSQEELNGFFRAINDAQSQAQNQATGGVDVANLFTKFDKNKDGKLTPDELTDERMFKALDLNKDGTVTRDEADTALKQLADRASQEASTATAVGGSRWSVVGNFFFCISAKMQEPTADRQLPITDYRLPATDH